MTKFGELIDVKVPVLFYFYEENKGEAQASATVLKEVASYLRKTAKIITINTHKNKKLAEVLRVKDLPTYMVYKEGEMKWRHSGTQNESDLIAKVNEYV